MQNIALFNIYLSGMWQNLLAHHTFTLSPYSVSSRIFISITSEAEEAHQTE